MPTIDPTFYRSPGDAGAAAPEQLAYVAAFDPTSQQKDALAVVDCDPDSTTFGAVVGWTELPSSGTELHHFGWSACSSALCHEGHGRHEALERRYLLVPGLRSSTTYVLDTKPDPRNPVVTHTIEASELAAKAGYSRPHTVHCGPGGIFMSALGGTDGAEGPGGVALIDHDTFEVIETWELDRGPQLLAYDVWWHLQYDTVITSEWATPSMIENGLNPEDLLGRKFGHHVNFWSMSERKLTQRVDLGDQHQMVLELRPAHDPSKAWGFVDTVISAEDLSASVWLWHKNGDQWTIAGRTYHAGAQENSSNMTSVTRSVREEHLRFASEHSGMAAVQHMTSVRRWISSSPSTISSPHQQACGALRLTCPPPFPGAPLLRRMPHVPPCCSVDDFCIDIRHRTRSRPRDSAAPLGHGADKRSWAAGTQANNVGRQSCLLPMSWPRFRSSRS